MVGKDAEAGGIAKHGAKLVTAVACAQVPKGMCKKVFLFSGIVNIREIKTIFFFQNFSYSVSRWIIWGWKLRYVRSSLWAQIFVYVAQFKNICNGR